MRDKYEILSNFYIPDRFYFVTKWIRKIILFSWQCRKDNKRNKAFKLSKVFSKRRIKNDKKKCEIKAKFAVEGKYKIKTTRENLSKYFDR